MFRTTLKSLWSRKRRLIGTGLAIVLGVSFLTATLVLGDSARAGFSAAFSDANEGIDTYVRSAQEFSADEETLRAPIDESLVDTIAALDVVDAAAGAIEGNAQILDAEGDPLGGDGPPTFGANWIDDPRLSGWDLADGRVPDADDEVVIDRASFEDIDAAIGEQITVLVPDPIQVTVVGVASFGDDDSIGGTTFVGFTDQRARDLFVAEDQVSAIVAAGVDGATQEQVTAAVAAAVPDGIVTMTGDELTEEMEDEIEGDFLGFMTTALTVFAGIALLVAAFSIYNTFSIIVAQRTRESALLRAIGASRRQVLASTLLESTLVGIVSAAIGAGVGIALGSGLLSLMDAIGFGLPTDGTVVTTTTLVISIVAGLVITVIGGVAPAWRASSVAPLAALRDVAVDDSDSSRIRIGVGLLISAVGAVLVVTAGAEIPRAAGGAVAILVGMLLLGPAVARPVAGLLGRPLRLRGVPGDLARRNAIRNPRRTASTASALLIGVGIVSMFTIFGSSIATSLEDEIDQIFAGDMMISTPGFGGAGISPGIVADVAATDSVEAAAGIGFGPATIDGRQEGVGFTDPAAYARLANFEVLEGDLAGVSTGSVAIEEDTAEEHGYQLGDTISIGFIDGAEAELEIASIIEAGELSDDYLVHGDLWTAHNAQATYFLTMIGVADGVDIDAAQADIEAILDGRGGLDVMDRQEFIDSSAGEVDVLLNVIYGLLAMAIIIALMGIANTMSLSIHERIRELGLLRAVGLTRSQLRSTVRWESMLVSTFGAVGGLGLGLFLSWGLVSALTESEGFGRYNVPVGSLVVILVLGAGAGLLAGLRPARRAARIDVLEAIASE